MGTWGKPDYRIEVCENPEGWWDICSRLEDNPRDVIGHANTKGAAIEYAKDELALLIEDDVDVCDYIDLYSLCKIGTHNYD